MACDARNSQCFDEHSTTEELEKLKENYIAALQANFDAMNPEVNPESSWNEETTGHEYPTGWFGSAWSFAKKYSTLVAGPTDGNNAIALHLNQLDDIIMIGAEAAAASTKTGADSVTFWKCSRGACVEEIARADYELWYEGLATDKAIAEDPGMSRADLAAAAAGDPSGAMAAIGATADAVDAAKQAAQNDLYQKNIIFKEQCLMLAKIFELAPINQALHEQKNEKPLPYYEGSKNSSLLVSGDPFGFINAMTQNSNKDKFFEMETKEISNLQPMIRLFKISSSPDNPQKEAQQEINFNSFFTNDANPGATGGTTDLQDFLNDKKKRGHGVGVKKFTFSYEADNPFSIKKAIKAKLVIHANSFDELLVDRGGYSYIELALKTGGLDHSLKDMVALDKMSGPTRDTVIENLQKLNFRLKALVGWACPEGEFGGSLVSSDLKNAIYDSCITLNLTPTIHEFNIDELGRVEFTLNYLAYVEDFFDQPNFDIFSSASPPEGDPNMTLGPTVSQLVRKIKYKILNEECKPDEVSKLRDKDKDLIESEKTIGRQSLMKEMLNTGRIRFLQIPLEKIAKFQQEGPYSKEITTEDFRSIFDGGKISLTSSGSASTEAEVTEDLTDPTDKDTYAEFRQKQPYADPVNPIETVTFFYVSDLVDCILEKIEKTLEAMPAAIADLGKGDTSFVTADYKALETQNYARFHENFKKFRIVLGPMEIVNPIKPSESRFINMGDIPISARYFLEWLTGKMLKSDKPMYPLPKFLNDFFNEFLRGFLNTDTCFGNKAKQKTRLNQTAITAYKNSDSNYDEITEILAGQRSNNAGSGFYPSRLNLQTTVMPVLSTTGARGNNVADPGFEHEINYLIYFAARTQPTERMNGLKSEDHPRGLWHYQIGKDRGIVKTIDLTKTDSPGLKEVRFEQHGYDGLQQLREQYDAQIKTYADVSAFPGNYIYIEPRGFSPSQMLAGQPIDLTQFGIGGYHMIIRSEHTFGPGIAESSITAKWVAAIEASAEKMENETVEDEGSSPSKCSTSSDSRQGAVQELMGGVVDFMQSWLTDAADPSVGSEHG